MLLRTNDEVNEMFIAAIKQFKQYIDYKCEGIISFISLILVLSLFISEITRGSSDMLDALLFPAKELSPLPLFTLISFAFMFVCYFFAITFCLLSPSAKQLLS